VSLLWLPTVGQETRSTCGRYEARGGYFGGSYAWRGRCVATDDLVCSSADLSMVKAVCARHAARVDAEVPA
jgi:hypothetical protein